MEISRRGYLTATGGALAAAAALASPAEANSDNNADVLYGHGMVWNRALSGVAGDVKLSFDLRVNPITGEGLGAASDPLHPDWNIHYNIDSVTSEKRPKGETRYTMKGIVTNANNPAYIGQSIAILAETVGDTTAVAIRLGDLAFGGAGFIVSIEMLFICVILVIGLIGGLSGLGWR